MTLIDMPKEIFLYAFWLRRNCFGAIAVFALVFNNGDTHADLGFLRQNNDEFESGFDSVGEIYTLCSARQYLKFLGSSCNLRFCELHGIVAKGFPGKIYCFVGENREGGGSYILSGRIV